MSLERRLPIAVTVAVCALSAGCAASGQSSSTAAGSASVPAARHACTGAAPDCRLPYCQAYFRLQDSLGDAEANYVSGPATFTSPQLQSFERNASAMASGLRHQRPPGWRQQLRQIQQIESDAPAIGLDETLISLSQEPSGPDELGKLYGAQAKLQREAKGLGSRCV